MSGNISNTYLWPCQLWPQQFFWSCSCKGSFAGLDLQMAFPWQSPSKMLQRSWWWINRCSFADTLEGVRKDGAVRPAEGDAWCGNVKAVVPLVADCRRDGVHRKKKLYPSRSESSERSGFGLTDVQNCRFWTSKSHRRQRIHSEGRYVSAGLSLKLQPPGGGRAIETPFWCQQL